MADLLLQQSQALQPSLFEGVKTTAALTVSDVLTNSGAVAATKKGVSFYHLSVPSTEKEIKKLQKYLDTIKEVSRKIVGITAPKEDTETHLRVKDYSDNERHGVNSALKSLDSRVAYPLCKTALLTYCLSRKLDALDSPGKSIGVALKVVYTTPALSEMLLELAPFSPLVKKICNGEVDSWKKAADLIVDTIGKENVIIPLQTRQQCKKFVLKNLELMIVPRCQEERYKLNGAVATAVDNAINIAKTSDSSGICFVAYNNAAQKAEIINDFKAAQSGEVELVVDAKKYNKAVMAGGPCVILAPTNEIKTRLSMVQGMQSPEGRTKNGGVFILPEKGALDPQTLSQVYCPLIIHEEKA